MVLSGEAILSRLNDGHIFRRGTWDKRCIKEASYALRIAADGLLIEDTFHEPGSSTFGKDYVEIGPGEIAILSTVERLNMPADLLGKIGIRIDKAMLGLTGLMGIQVDPLYGKDRNDERLFVRVANFGNDTIRLDVGEQAFTFELHTVIGVVKAVPKENTWTRLRATLSGRSRLSWTFVAQVQQNVGAVEENFKEETGRIRANLQPVILFGVFLVAVTVLSVSISLIFSLRDTPTAKVPPWVTEWGWVLIIITLVAATLATAALGSMMAAQVFLNTLTDWRSRPERQRDGRGNSNH